MSISNSNLDKLLWSLRENTNCIAITESTIRIWEDGKTDCDVFSVICDQHITAYETELYKLQTLRLELLEGINNATTKEIFFTQEEIKQPHKIPA